MIKIYFEKKEIHGILISDENFKEVVQKADDVEILEQTEIFGGFTKYKYIREEQVKYLYESQNGNGLDTSTSTWFKAEQEIEDFKRFLEGVDDQNIRYQLAFNQDCTLSIS